MRHRFVHLAIGAVVTVALITGALFVFTPTRAQTVTYGTVVVNTSFLNVRNGPGSQFLVMGVVKGGSELPVTGITRSRDWWQVETPFGEGFVFADFVLYRGDGSVVPFVGASADAAPEPPSVIVLAQSLNVRTGPSVNFPSLGTVPQTFVMSITGQNVKTGWYQVISPFGIGWVANDEVALAGDTSIIPRVDGSGGGSSLAALTVATSPTTSAGAATASGTVATSASLSGFSTIAEEQLNFVPTGFATGGVVQWDALSARSRPWFGSAIVGGFAKGDTVTIMGRNDDGSFLLLDSGDFGPGWVLENGVRHHVDLISIPIVDINPQLSIEGKPRVETGEDITTGGGPVGRTTHDDVVVHIRPQPAAPAIGSLGASVIATVIGRDFDIQYYQIPTPFGVGWVRARHDFNLERNINPFDVPVTAVNGIPVGGETTTITTTTGTTAGVVRSGASSTLAGPIVVVNTSNMNLRSGPGPQFSVISVVTGGSQYTVTGQLSDSSWYRVNTPFGEGWLFADFVVFRGDASTVPVISS